MPAGLKAYWAKKRGKRTARRAKRAVAANPRKKHRRSRRSRMKHHRTLFQKLGINPRRRRRRSSRRHGGAVRVHHRRRRHARRHHAVASNPHRHRRHHRRHRRHARSNPGHLTLVGGLTGIPANLKATWKGGAKAWGLAALGAGAGIIGGTFLARMTTPVIAKFVPAIVIHPLGARILGVANYYLAGWAMARFIPGLKPQTRQAIITGAAVGALTELIKPGLIRSAASRLPVVGSFFGTTLEGMADDLGSYVSYALSGSGDNGRHLPTSLTDNTMSGVGDYVQLDAQDQREAMMTDGMGDYVQLQ